MVGIYKLTSPSGKVYVGQSTNIEWRWEQYEKYPASYRGQRRLYNSLQKYGFESHKCEVLEECSIERLDELEVYWGKKLNVLGPKGLVCKLGNGKGIVSEETKQLMSQNIKGKKLGSTSKGSGRKKGYKMSDEHKAKIAATRIGKPSNHKGFKDSPKTIEKKRNAKLGMKYNKNGKQ